MRYLNIILFLFIHIQSFGAVKLPGILEVFTAPAEQELLNLLEYVHFHVGLGTFTNRINVNEFCESFYTKSLLMYPIPVPIVNVTVQQATALAEFVSKNTIIVDKYFRHNGKSLPFNVLEVVILVSIFKLCNGVTVLRHINNLSKIILSQDHLGIYKIFNENEEYVRTFLNFLDEPSQSAFSEYMRLVTLKSRSFSLSNIPE